MSETTQTPHRLARDYLERRTLAPEALPTREEVRCELGWALIVALLRAQAERDERN